MWVLLPLLLLPLAQSRRNRSHIATGTNEVSFVVIGDWGSGDARQKRVATALDRVVARMPTPPTLVLSTGDQLYDFGARSPTDPIFGARFNDVYGWLPAIKDLPWFMTLGNHDCLGRRDAVIRHHAVTWRFPAPDLRRFNLTGTGPALPGFYAADFALFRVIVLDTCVLHCTLAAPSERSTHCAHYMSQYGTAHEAIAHAKVQVEWFKLEVANPRHANTTVFVMGHEPAYSTLMYGEQQYLKPLVQVMKRHHVAAYLSGHAHSMQAISLNATTKASSKHYVFHQIVSGGGGGYLLPRSPSLRAHFNTRYARAESGFVIVHVREKKNLQCAWRATFYRVLDNGHVEVSHKVTCADGQNRTVQS